MCGAGLPICVLLIYQTSPKKDKNNTDVDNISGNTFILVIQKLWGPHLFPLSETVKIYNN